MTPLVFFDAPLLKYLGGKWQLADWVIGQMPPHLMYVEPCSGGASVFLRKERSYHEVLNDIDGDVVNFYQMLRDRTDDLIRMIDLTPFSATEYKRSFEPCAEPLERARRLYVRCWQGFHGNAAKPSWRRQKTATGTSRANVVREWQRHDTLWAAAERLKDAVLECASVVEIIKRYDSAETLFYVDPPYPKSARTDAGRTKYRHEMPDEVHRELADTLKQCKGMAMVSGYDCALYRELYADWHCIHKTTTTSGNSVAMEYLWLSPRTVAMNTLPLFQLGT